MDKLEQNARDQALLVSKHTEEFEKAFGEYLVSLDDLEEGSFWQLHHLLIDILRIQLADVPNNTDAWSLAISDSVSSFFVNSKEQLLSHDDQKEIWYTQLDAIRFAKTWSTKEKQLKTLLNDLKINTNYAVGVLVAGENFILRLLSEEIQTEGKLLNEFKPQHPLVFINLLTEGHRFGITKILQTAAKYAFYCETGSW